MPPHFRSTTGAAAVRGPCHGVSSRPYGAIRLCIFSLFALLATSGRSMADCALEFGLAPNTYDCLEDKSSCDLERELGALSDAGNLEAKFYLAHLLRKKIDEDAADPDQWGPILELYKESADGGFILAQRDLGMILYRAKAYDSAFHYLQQAATCGVRGAAPLALSKMYSEGLGVPADEGKAACWAEFAMRAPLDTELSC